MPDDCADKVSVKEYVDRLFTEQQRQIDIQRDALRTYVEARMWLVGLAVIVAEVLLRVVWK